MQPACPGLVHAKERGCAAVGWPDEPCKVLYNVCTGGWPAAAAQQLWLGWAELQGEPCSCSTLSAWRGTPGAFVDRAYLQMHTCHLSDCTSVHSGLCCCASPLLACLPACLPGLACRPQAAPHHPRGAAAPLVLPGYGRRLGAALQRHAHHTQLGQPAATGGEYMRHNLDLRLHKCGLM